MVRSVHVKSQFDGNAILPNANIISTISESPSQPVSPYYFFEGLPSNSWWPQLGASDA